MGCLGFGVLKFPCTGPPEKEGKPTFWLCVLGLEPEPPQGLEGFRVLGFRGQGLGF